MNKHVLVVLSGFLMAAAFAGCGLKQNYDAFGKGRTGDEEAQRVAEKFADLLISKCAGGVRRCSGERHSIHDTVQREGNIISNWRLLGRALLGIRVEGGGANYAC
jgi:hypothetical protein